MRAGDAARVASRGRWFQLAPAAPLSIRSLAGLILKRTRKTDSVLLEDYDVLCDGQVGGRIFHGGHSASSDRPWFWGLGYEHIDDRMPTHGYEPTREAAMAAFRKSWDQLWAHAT